MPSRSDSFSYPQERLASHERLNGLGHFPYPNSFSGFSTGAMLCWYNPSVWPLLAFSLLGRPSLANTTYALSLIDWNNIPVQYVDVSAGLNPPDWTWTSQQGAVDALAGDGEASASESATYDTHDFSTPLISASQSIHAQSIAGPNSKRIAAFAYSENSYTTRFPFSSGSNKDKYKYANARAVNYGTFSLSGVGLALIALDWVKASEARSGSGLLPQVIITAKVGGVDDGRLGQTYQGHTNRQGTYLLPIVNTNPTASGTGSLWAEVNASAFKRLHYQANVNTPSSVPLPADLWAWSGGMLAWMSFAGRKASIA